jgi:hypothetical protein
VYSPGRSAKRQQIPLDPISGSIHETRPLLVHLSWLNGKQGQHISAFELSMIALSDQTEIAGNDHRLAAKVQLTPKKLQRPSNRKTSHTLILKAPFESSPSVP